MRRIAARNEASHSKKSEEQKTEAKFDQDTSKVNEALTSIGPANRLGPNGKTRPTGTIAGT